MQDQHIVKNLTFWHVRKGDHHRIRILILHICCNLPQVTTYPTTDNANDLAKPCNVTSAFWIIILSKRGLKTHQHVCAIQT